ncbi:MAG: hypothetical protein H5T86_13740 [Armatimonadetes bacterium]|nr:hypothetical protein [Armatimonadota bacterium]
MKRSRVLLWASLMLFLSAPMRSVAEGLCVALLPPPDRPDVRRTVDRLAARLGFKAVTISPEEMVVPDVFTARRFHAAIYTGFERYLYQVRQPGDAVSALMRYLGESGTLVVAGGCWPFYRPCRWDGKEFLPYNGPIPAYEGPRDEWLEQQMARLQQSPVGTFNRFLGLNIAGEGTEQFERPPGNDRIIFRTTEQGRRLFPSLPESFPFPSYGDLRFRPASDRNLGEGVRYTSVATAFGESGKKYGDGICVIEHTSGRLAGGMVLYIWGTLLDGQMADALLTDALRIAARRAGLVAQVGAREAELLAAKITELQQRISRDVGPWPERLYFARHAERLAQQIGFARLAAELGNAERAAAIIAQVTQQAESLSRRVAESEQ